MPSTSFQPLALIRLMRPHQWLKNGFVFAGLVFSQAWQEGPMALKVLHAFAAFCCLSSMVYIINDWHDRASDALHPTKRHRPLASGTVAPALGLVLAAVLLAAGLAFAAGNRTLLVLMAIYVVFNLAYSWRLKQVPVVDVSIIASGFMLRLLAGTVAVGIPPSRWLLLTGMFVALFLGFSKRKAETFHEEASQRAVLAHYPAALLDTFMAVTMTATLTTYSLFATSPEAQLQHGERLLYTVPVVIFGMLRYTYQVHRGRGEDVARDLLRDPWIIAAGICWLAIFFKPPPVRVAPDPDSPRRLPVKQLVLVLALVATVYAAALLIWGDSPRAALAHLWSWTGLQAAALCLLNYLLRGVRWRLWMAHYGRQFGWLQGLRLYLAGYAFTPTPGNVGEALRGMLLARQPLGTAQSLAIFSAERLADLLCLLLLCLPAVWWLLTHGAVQASPALLGGLLLAALAVGAMLVSVVFRYRDLFLNRLPWLHEAWQCLSVRPLVWFGLTLVAWAAQGVAVWLICREMGVHMMVPTAAGFYAVAMVAGALSALPAGLGGMEAVLTGLLVAQSATAGQALAITVMARLLTLWLAVAIGVGALLYSAAIRKEISFR